MVITSYLTQQNIRASDLAARLGVPSSTVTRWLRGERTPSAEMAIRIEQATGIPREQLRPDLYTREASQ